VMKDFNEDDIDLTTYFEEIIYCSESINDIHNNLEPVSLKKDDLFNTFDEAELSENNKVVRKRTILCKHSGLYKSKNTQKQKDSCWFVEVTWEEKTNTLTNLFWMSSEQILLWYEFGKAIGHDNTAGTNRYNMPLSLFVVQDDNMQSCIVSQAFVSNEITETYQ
ncbi:16859_t:CDS:2, partial [Racocetra persica]